MPTKVHLVKAMVFPVVMYRWESWTIKKAERQRIDAFELWCWRRLLRVPWTARRSNQSILKKISPEYLLEGLILKLKLQYFGHLMWRTHLKRPWGWERLKAGREGDYRGWDGWMASQTQWTWVWVNSRSWWWTGRPGVLQSMGLQRVGHDWVTELNWTDVEVKTWMERQGEIWMVSPLDAKYTQLWVLSLQRILGKHILPPHPGPLPPPQGHSLKVYIDLFFQTELNRWTELFLP